MNDVLLTLGFFAGSALLLWLFLWSWRGRSGAARWWYRDTYGGDSIAMGVVPGAGVILFGVGLLRLLPEAVSAMPVVMIVAGAMVLLVGAVLPFAWGPAFYKEYRKRQRARAKGR